MIAIILNSGMGSRLGDLTKNNPKSLVNLKDDETIFSRAISILSKFNISEYIITTGYLDNVLKEYIKHNFPNFKFIFVHNELFDQSNYIKSMDLIQELDDDIILLHGDLVFNMETATKIINNPNSCVVIDSSVKIPKDDFKAKVIDNKIKYIGVDYFEEDAVACQPFYKLKNEDWKIWKKKIQEFCENGEVNVYAENALNTLLNKLQIGAIDINGELCMEIDTKSDLNNVREILK